jgi:signal peptidase I
MDETTDYATYTLEQLEHALRHTDEERYPDYFRQIADEIEKRRKELSVKEALEARGAKMRNPRLAFLLSFVCQGLGQLYNGQPKRAMVFFSLEIILSAIVLVLLNTMFGSFPGAVAAFAFFVSVVLAFAVLVAADAYKVASKIRELELRRYNRWYVYVSIILAFTYLIHPSLRQLIPIGFRSYSIPSSTMEPTLLVGDYLVSDPRYYRSHKPQRGDVVIFTYPLDRTKVLIRRVIALEGESIEIRDKQIYVDGRKIEDRFAARRESTAMASDFSPDDSMGPVLIPSGFVFVLGDNKALGLDSRSWGPLDVRDTIAKPLYVYWAKDKSRIGTDIR